MADLGRRSAGGAISGPGGKSTGAAERAVECELRRRARGGQTGLAASTFHQFQRGRGGSWAGSGGAKTDRGRPRKHAGSPRWLRESYRNVRFLVCAEKLSHGRRRTSFDDSAVWLAIGLTVGTAYVLPIPGIRARLTAPPRRA